MKTLNENYNKNIEILKENLNRGLSYDQAIKTVDHFENQFITHNLYNDDEKMFINEMKTVINKHFKVVEVKATSFAKNMGITVFEI